MKAIRPRIIPLAEAGLRPDQVLISKAALNTVKKLQKAGFEAYLVGGAIRDLLLGLAPKDFDVATAATPEQGKKLFGRRSRIIGRRFRLLHVYGHDREIIEVATFRTVPPSSNTTQGGRVAIDNTYGTAAEDALRRDLTANALMFDPSSNKIIDYTNGYQDISAKVLRLIGNEQLRYREDPVRILRVLRLAAKLKLSIARGTAAPIRRHHQLLLQMPAPRLLDEILKMLRSGQAVTSFQLMLTHGVLGVLFPHTTKFSASEKAFVERTLSQADRQYHAGNHVSASIHLGALFWPAIARQWQALNDSADLKIGNYLEVLTCCGLRENKLVSRRIESHIEELWYLQALFQLYRNTKRSARLRKRNRKLLRKALDFLRLRAEDNKELGEQMAWWEDYLFGDIAIMESAGPDLERPESR